jgi:ERCC4-type nuclease
LEGGSCHFEAVGFKREAVQGALVSLSLIYKIPLLRSKTPEETARLMMYASRQIKSKECQQVYVRPYPYSRRLNGKFKRQIHVLQGLPGIGPKRAKLLLNKFGDIKEHFQCLTPGLGETLGIGKKIAKQINRIIE